MANADILLTPGEKGLYGKSFRPNLVLFWLRTNALVTNRRLAIKAPNTIFGVFPVGFEERSMPIGSIAGITSSLAVLPMRLFFNGGLALLFLVLSFSAIGGNDSGEGGNAGAAILFFLLFALFALLATTGIVAKLTITNSGGGTSEQSVSFLEMSGLESFKNRADEFIYSAGPAGQSWEQAYEQGNVGNPDQQWNAQTQGTLPPTSGPMPFDGAPGQYGGMPPQPGGAQYGGQQHGGQQYAGPGQDPRDQGRHPYGQRDHDAPYAGRVATSPGYGGQDATVGEVAERDTPVQGYRIPADDDRGPTDRRDRRGDAPRDDFR